MQERNITIEDLEPLFAERDVIFARELWQYLRVSQVQMNRYIRRAGLVRHAGRYYLITRQQAEQIIRTMLGEEEHGR